MIKILDRIIDVFLNDLLPKTKISVSKGNKIFGGFILNKDELDCLCIGTNNEIENPIYHGEISTIVNFFNIKNLNPKNYYFISSHEPCSLCLSAITWSGFDNFYYLFPYEETNSSFNIPHDLKILNQVFSIQNGQYNKSNKYWNSFSILDEISKLKNDKEKTEILLKLDKIKEIYSKLSHNYQENKQNNNIPLN